MSAEGASVDCPECGESFDPSKAGGWCTNPDCGEFRWDGDDGGGTSADEPEDESDDDTTTCADCGEVVPDRKFCKECGHELGTEPEGVGDDPEGLDPEPLTSCPSCAEDVENEWSACPFCGEDLDQHRGETGDGSGAETDGPGAETDGPGAETDGPGDEDEPPEKVVLEVGETDIEAEDGDAVGRKVRTAHVHAGGDESEAQYIHREHVRFELDGDAFALVNEGRNGTRLNGEELELEERATVENGDEVTFSDVATATIRVE